MLLAITCNQEVAPRVTMGSTDREIREFLTGKNDGAELLHAIYDDVLDEPVPERLLAVLRR
jgi:Anti-sigma factor NepR